MHRSSHGGLVWLKFDAWIPWRWMGCCSDEAGTTAPPPRQRGGLDSKTWSLDSEAWIQWRWIRGSRRLMWTKFEAWIPKLGFHGGGCGEAKDWCGDAAENVVSLQIWDVRTPGNWKEIRWNNFLMPRTLRISWICIVLANCKGFRVAKHGNSNFTSSNLFLFSAFTVTASNKRAQIKSYWVQKFYLWTQSGTVSSLLYKYIVWVRANKLLWLSG